MITIISILWNRTISLFPAAAVCFLIVLSPSPAKAALNLLPDTLVNGIRCEPAEIFFFPPELYIGSTVEVVPKKILKDGSFADFTPAQRFVVQINDTSDRSRFRFHDSLAVAETSGVMLPLRLKLGLGGTFNVKVWAILPKKRGSEAPYIPLSIPSSELGGKIYQTSGYRKLNLGFFEPARSDFRSAARADSLHRELYYYDIACTFAREGKLTDALDWLRTAVDSGYRYYIHALQLDPDLKSLRRLPEFKPTIIAPLVRTRSKLLIQLQARPEFASDNYLEIAHTYLLQGDTDSFYVSLECGLQHGLVPNLEKLREESEFRRAEDDPRLDSLVRRYAASALVPGLEEEKQVPGPTNLRPIVHPKTLALQSTASRYESVVILQTGDSTIGISFYALDWKQKSVRCLGSMTPSEAKHVKNVQVNWQGIVAFTSNDPPANERLYVRNGDSTASYDAPFRDASMSGRDVQESHSFPSFSLSTSGTDIVACASRDLFIVDTANATLFSQVLVSRLQAGKNKFDSPRIDTFATEGYDADERFYRILTGWDFREPEAVLLQDFYPEQLGTTTARLWKYYPRTRTYTLASSDAQIYFSSSFDDKYILYTNNDETCCSGINYSDNCIFLQNTETLARTVIYSEWDRFGNEGKSEEHEPRTAKFSPDGERIAATINNLYVPGGRSTGRKPKIDEPFDDPSANDQLFIFGINGTVQFVVSNREFIGWLDDTHVLVRQIVEDFDQNYWKSSRSELRVCNIESGIEHPLLSTDADCIGIQWRVSR